MKLSSILSMFMLLTVYTTGLLCDGEATTKPTVLKNIFSGVQKICLTLIGITKPTVIEDLNREANPNNVKAKED